MKVITAVLKDLYTFAFKYKFGFFNGKKEESVHIEQFTQALQKVSSEVTVEATPPAITAEADVVSVPESPHDVNFESVGYAYVPDAFLYALPTKTFDGVITRLKYGESFRILNNQGKWLNVEFGDIKGWMHMDDTTDSSAELHPRFAVGTSYGHDDASTVKLRTLIDDEFHAAQLEVYLQNIEYVTYMLQKKGMCVAWGSDRPRIAGTWQRLLKGVVGVHIGVTPKTGAVMEYIKTDNTGHVCYIQSVYPDGSFTLTEVGHLYEGVYGERTLSKDEWKEFGPIFIEVA
ncbi:MAG: hypothetical protein ACI9VM_000376 [Candidatus Azotimanducaceae bacterium]|jgi:hypothetical protein